MIDPSSFLKVVPLLGEVQVRTRDGEVILRAVAPTTLRAIKNLRGVVEARLNDLKNPLPESASEC